MLKSSIPIHLTVVYRFRETKNTENNTRRREFQNFYTNETQSQTRLRQENIFSCSPVIQHIFYKFVYASKLNGRSIFSLTYEVVVLLFVFSHKYSFDALEENERWRFRFKKNAIICCEILIVENCYGIFTCDFSSYCLLTQHS